MGEENYNTTSETISQQELVCNNCGSLPVVEGYAVPLCSDCRSRFTNYPIPGWLKLLSVVIVAIMVFALIQFPKSISAGVAFERGQRAEKEKRFATAAKEYKKVVDIFPQSFIAKGKLFVAYVRNLQIDEAEKTFDQIKGTKSNNSSEVSIIKEANEAVAILDSYYDVKKELIDLLNQQRNEDLQTSLKKLEEYTQKNPKEFFGFYYLGDTLYDSGKYREAKDAYVKAIQLKPNMPIARLGASAAFRQIGEYENAIAQCNKVLETNQEFAEAYASLCKIDLKRHQFSSALDLAKKAYELNKDSIGVIETMALAYHYNGLTKERDEVVNTLKSMNDPYLSKLQEVFEGKSKIYE